MIRKKFEQLIVPHRGFRNFYRIKNRMFPVYSLLEHFPSSGSLTDLGCGNGLFPALLSMRYPNLRVQGFDSDTGKINEADTLFRSLGCSFYVADLCDLKIPVSLHYSLIDVLYLLPYKKQERLLTDIKENMTSGEGRLLIKEMDRKPFFKYFFNLLQETVSVKIISRTMGHRFFFRSSESMLEMLNRLGFRTRVLPLHRGYAYPHVLYIASKR